MVVIIATTLIWTGLFRALDAPKAHESIQLFLATNAFSDDLDVDLEVNLSEQGVKDVVINAVAPDSPYFFTMLSTIGILDCDLLLLPEVVLAGVEDITNFVPLEADYLVNFDIAMADYSRYMVGSVDYGIQVYDATSETNLMNRYFSISGEENYYLVVNANTVNCAPYSKATGTTSSRSFAALSFLLNQATIS
ncbi:MAG: hypothetical protein WC399_03845 [Bacilli bacterium]